MSISYFFRGNLPPFVTALTVTPAPATTGTPITFTCSATDLDGSVVSVDYFLDGVYRATGTAGPSFSASFTPATTGVGRVVAAVATDNLGVKSVIFTGTPLTVNGASTAPGTMAPITGVVNSTTSITLTYAAPNNGGSAITDYTYSYSSNAGSTYTVFAHTATTALTQPITGLLPGTAYQFHVAAVNAIGTGGASADLLLSTTAASTAPSQVSGLVLSAATTSSLAASWSLPASNGAAITDYFVEYSSNGGTSYAAFIHTASTALTQTITGLAAGTSYMVRVSAVNSVGTGAASAVMSLSTTVASTAPGQVTGVSGSATSASSVTLTYVAPASNGGSAITDYQYTYSSNGGSTYTVFSHTATTALSQTITGLVGGTNYQFRVAAINAIGTGAFSTPDLLLSTPAAQTITATSATPS